MLNWLEFGVVRPSGPEIRLIFQMSLQSTVSFKLNLIQEVI